MVTFHDQKSELSDKMIPLIKDIGTAARGRVRYIRCDNSGENNKLEEICRKETLGIEYEIQPRVLDNKTAWWNARLLHCTAE
jgi:hypothetical protein